MNIYPIENGYVINGSRIEQAPDFVQYTKNISFRVGEVYIRKKAPDAKRTIKSMHYADGVLFVECKEEGLGKLNFVIESWICTADALRNWGRK